MRRYRNYLTAFLFFVILLPVRAEEWPAWLSANCIGCAERMTERTKDWVELYGLLLVQIPFDLVRQFGLGHAAQQPDRGPRDHDRPSRLPGASDTPFWA